MFAFSWFLRWLSIFSCLLTMYVFSFAKELHLPSPLSYLFLEGLCILDSNLALVMCYRHLLLFSYFVSFCFIYSFLWETEGFHYFFSLLNRPCLWGQFQLHSKITEQRAEGSPHSQSPRMHGLHYQRPHQRDTCVTIPLPTLTHYQLFISFNFLKILFIF